MLGKLLRLAALTHCVLVAPQVWAADLGVPELKKIQYPDDEPPSDDLVNLGKVLFFDKRLSFNDTLSCGSCHNPDKGFSDGVPIGNGAEGNKLARHSPHLYNLAWASVLQWDGKADNLDKQALGPIKNPKVMNQPIDKAIEKLKAVPFYVDQFKKIFPADGLTGDNLGKALGAYERSIITMNSPFDRFIKGETSALSAAAQRGLALYKDEKKTNCMKCHDGPNFTDDSFHNIGLKGDDAGRKAIVNDQKFYKAFKTPGLRNVELSDPYMHDGSLKTLEEVVRFYNAGGEDKNNLDPLIKPLGLTDAEVADLVEFLKSLTERIAFSAPHVP